MLITLILTYTLVSFGLTQDVRTAVRKPLEYIQEVFSTLTTDEEGHPKDLKNGPTSVWFLQDTRILNNASSDQNGNHLNGVSLFQFDWSSIAKSSDNDVSKGVFRAHLRALATWHPANVAETVSVTANVSVGILDGNGKGIPASAFVEANFSVATNYSEWIEIEVTESLKALWSRGNASVLTITVQLTSPEGQTAAGGFVPAEIVDPLVVPIDERSKGPCLALQPMLLLYLEDSSLKTQALALSSGPAVRGVTLHTVTRPQRAALPGSCELRNYTVTFADIGIDYVLFPETLNVGECSGGCASSYQRSMPPGTVTNHASVVAAAGDSAGEGERAKSVITCCAPLKYQPVYFLVVNTDNIVRVQLFSDMVASICGCG